MRSQEPVHGFDDVLLQRASAGVADLLGDFLRIAAGHQAGGGQQRGHLRTVDRIERDAALGIGRALLDELRGFLGGGAQHDGIAVGLAHLAPVKARNLRSVGQDGVRLREHRVLLGIALVETTRDGAGDLDVRQVVLADRHDVRLAEQDVASLMNRIGEQQAGQRVAGSLHLGLHGRVAVQFGLSHQRKERQHQLVLGRNRGMREDHGLFRVDAGGHVVEHQIEHVLLDVLGGVAVGDHLIVGDDDVGLHAAVLHGHALADRAEVVAEVQAAGRTVAGEHGELARILLQFGKRGIGTLLCGEEARAHFIADSSDLLLLGFVRHTCPFLKKINDFIVKV